MKLIHWISLLGLVVLSICLWQFREILLLMFMAIVLATALNSLVRNVSTRFSLQRNYAVPIAILIVVAVLTFLFSVILPPFFSQFEQLLLLIPQGFDRLVSFANTLLENPPDWLPHFNNVNLLPPFPDLIQQGAALLQKVFGNFFDFFSGSLAVVLQIFLVLILTLMLVTDPIAYRNLLLRLLPAFYRPRAEIILTRCESKLLGWMRGTAISSVFVAITSAIGLTILGVPFVLAHALLAGLFNFIPNIGPTLSLVFPISVALLNSFGQAIAVLVLYVIIQNLESYWISPLVMQQQVSLLPAATLIAQIFFTSVLGPLGLVLALPLTVVTKTVMEEALVKDVLDRWQSNISPPPTLYADSLPETPEGEATKPFADVAVASPQAPVKSVD